jgi:hypothetical protein
LNEAEMSKITQESEANGKSCNPMSAEEAGVLKACPFCGGREVRILKPTCRPETPYNAADRLYPVARCATPGCGGENTGKNEDYSGKSAAEAWNRRAALPDGEPAGWFNPWNETHGYQQVAPEHEGEPGTVPLFTHPASEGPKGWKLVPEEPTREMWAAAGNAICKLQAQRVGHHDKLSEAAWNAMLAAAPSIPEGE